MEPIGNLIFRVQSLENVWKFVFGCEKLFKSFMFNDRLPYVAFSGAFPSLQKSATSDFIGQIGFGNLELAL